MRGAPPTREPKIPVTELVGRSRELVEFPDHVRDSIQGYLKCGCRLDRCGICEYFRAKIGGKSFTSGEKLSVGTRCGSITTMVTGGRSVYGRIKNFYRVMCECDYVIDFTLITWFPFPTYPDSDPLTIKILLGGLNVNNIPGTNVVPLYDLQPSRIGVEIDNVHSCMYMLRFDGIDTNPLFCKNN